jgi:hypothetical protein
MYQSGGGDVTTALHQPSEIPTTLILLLFDNTLVLFDPHTGI